MYRLHPPAAGLAPYVESYWFVGHDPGEELDLQVDVFVDARADLIFNFEAPYTRTVIGGASERLRSSNLDAQRLVPIRISQRGAVRIAGVRFRLGGVAPFTRVRLADLTGRTPAPDEVFGPEARELETALDRAPSIEAGAAALDAFLLERMRLDDAQRDLERVLGALVESGGHAAPGVLAESAGISPRQVERLVARGVGVAPRTLGRVLRFQGALRALMTDPGVPLGDVAAAAGYYDQAHFIRDFRAFSGGVPRGYRGYYPRESPTDFAPNVVAFVQDGVAATP